ncbi:spike base protein, RCAP_Rcc01079 family [Sphingomonas baiyangensis]|uniref:Uncharacterized protein n=1 Tax=Sphingomonas baiyangensis TaxID=2572576 RepID=A0A4U1L5S9_9SPHN|nr:hypothetical protein [Sphingomonas baiyangensis]TKD52299.1 hypothetical protein FBR43_13510 [Sphingomonas baiyangensis]
MADAFGNHADQVSAPATRAVAIVPHDTTPLADIPKALFVGGGGTIVARGAGGGDAVAFAGLAAGSILPLRASHVLATGTTATGIVALY